jgi:hypothetical protein
MASVKANPKIANLNKSSFRVGLQVKEKIREEKTNPIPKPAPVKPYSQANIYNNNFLIQNHT